MAGLETSLDIRAKSAAADVHRLAEAVKLGPGASEPVLTPISKKTIGSRPLTVFVDHGRTGSGEPLAIVLRRGTAGLPGRMRISCGPPPPDALTALTALICAVLGGGRGPRHRPSPRCRADLRGLVSELSSQRRADCDRRQWMQAGVDDRSPLPLTVAS